MSAPAPGVLPTTVMGTPVAQSGVGSGGAAATTGALAAMVARFKDVGASIYKQQKPWSEVVDRNTLSKPANFTEALGRVKKNLAYFKVNYLLVVLSSCIVTFVFHPYSLFVLAALVAAWIYLLFIQTAPLVIGGRQFSDREKVLGLAAISFITIFFLTSVGAEFFSAISFSLAVVLLHGAFREPDNLFVDDQESLPLVPVFGGILPVTTAVPVGMAAV